jgi:hypothetical protein
MIDLSFCKILLSREDFLDDQHYHHLSLMGEPAPRRSGVAQVKAEYILPKVQARRDIDDDFAEEQTNPATIHAEGQEQAKSSDGEQEASSKRVKLSGAAKKKARREAEAEKRKAHRGQNKGRKFAGIRDQVTLCNIVARGKKCDRKVCVRIVAER